MATTAPTYFELLAPVYHRRLKKEERVVKAFMKETRVLGLDADSAERGGEIMADLLRIGKQVNALDVLIAGIAIANNSSTIVTSDRDFEEIPKVADVRVVFI